LIIVNETVFYNTITSSIKSALSANSSFNVVVLSYVMGDNSIEVSLNFYYKYIDTSDPAQVVIRAVDVFVNMIDGARIEFNAATTYCYSSSGGLPPGASSAGITIGATVGGAAIAGVGAASAAGGFLAYRHFSLPPLPDQLPGQADVFAQGQAYDNSLHIQQGHECFNEVYEEYNRI